MSIEFSFFDIATKHPIRGWLRLSENHEFIIIDQIIDVHNGQPIPEMIYKRVRGENP